jgi:hypothetical protein
MERAYCTAIGSGFKRIVAELVGEYTAPESIDSRRSGVPRVLKDLGVDRTVIMNCPPVSLKRQELKDWA